MIKQLSLALSLASSVCFAYDTVTVTDTTRLELEYLKSIQSLSEHDSTRLTNTVQSLQNSTRELRGLAKNLNNLSDESFINPTPLQDFLSAVRDYQAEYDNVKSEIDALALMPPLHGDALLNPDFMLSFEPLADHLQQRLATINAPLNALNFQLLLPNGAYHPQMGIDTAELKQLSLYTAAQISEMRRNVMRLKAMSSQDRRVIDESINRFTRVALQNFIDTFGSSERYRTSHDKEGLEETKALLLDAFWARSYIRATYGIAIGAIPVDYSKRIFNMDHYLSNMNVGAAPTYDQNHLIHYRNLATEALVNLKDASSRNWTSISSWLTWGSGKTSEVDTKFFIIELMRRDLDEELTLSKNGGFRQVRIDYRNHYFTTDALRKTYEDKARNIFNPDRESLDADLGMVDPSSLKGAIALCLSSLENQENRLDEANKLQSTLDLINTSNQVQTRRKQRTPL